MSKVWSEQQIGTAIYSQFLKLRHLMVVPNCGWTGYECDLLAVTNKGQIIDFEIKRTRSDFLADAKKSKWIDFAPVMNRIGDTKPALWPRRVWKHYYVMPAEIFKADMIDLMPSKKSGILTFSSIDDRLFIKCEKSAYSNPDFKDLNTGDLISIARLTSIRFWQQNRGAL